MKFISWNVNGLRACLKKGFEDVFNALDADFFCIQETKMQPGQADFAPAGYTEYIYSAEKKGYSGTAIWAKTPALSVRYGLDEDVHNHEGRAITLEYPDFYLVNLYVPNSQNELARIDYRMQWEASCWPRALRIPSASCTPTPPACTAGGACASAPVSGTQAGESTISSSAAAWPIRSRKQRS